MVCSKTINLVAAVDQNYGIGLDNDLPWHIPEDLSFFNRLTKLGIKEPGEEIENSDPTTAMNVCIMGRKTWDSIPAKVRPLGGRFNIIVSKNKHSINLKGPKYEHVRAVSSIAEGLQLVDEINSTNNKLQLRSIFIVGGSSIYEQALREKHVRLFITHVQNPGQKQCTVFFPHFSHLPDIKRKTFGELASLVPFEIAPGKLVSKTGIEYEFTLYQNF